jgi:hypothetical protein
VQRGKKQLAAGKLSISLGLVTDANSLKSELLEVSVLGTEAKKKRTAQGRS